MIIPKTDVKIGDLVYLTDTDDVYYKNFIWAADEKSSVSIYQYVISTEHPFLILDNYAKINVIDVPCFKCLHETKGVVYIRINTIRTVDKIG